jgi:hypothetical protein
MFQTLLFPVSSFSQGEFNNWYFDNKLGLTFNTIPPTPLTNSSIHCVNTGDNSVVSDSLGNLLFYTGLRNGNGANDGIVFNRNHLDMPNSHNLFSGGDPPQTFLAIKKPAEDSIYYLFTLDNR